jgi:hypothetical protein|nr:MAG TPA: Minor capsid protein [Caudoviricetes sp.]
MIRVTIDYNRINNRMEQFKDKLYPAVKQQLKKGADTFTPYLGGDLMDSADPSAHDSTPYLVYDIRYARYQFYANGGAPDHDFPHRTRTVHPLASMMWTDVYLKAGGARDLQYIVDNAPQLLNF